MIDNERSVYNIKKGDLVVPITRSLTRNHKGGLGVVLEEPQVVSRSQGVVMSYLIYWQQTRKTAVWELAHGYLKRVDKKS